MGFTLILAEKREAANRIALALDEKGRPSHFQEGSVPYYESINKGKTLRIVPAIGHLYGISPSKKSYSYPVLDVRWAPAFEFNPRLKHTRRWIDAIAKLAEGASEYISATDYDIEGEVIGCTILRFACGGKERIAKRMIFSTLASTDLWKAFQNLALHIDFGLAEAGETRHIVDFLWGINISRALTTALKSLGKGFTNLSSGRVQGPALGFVVEREKEISCFVPTPYYTISAVLEVQGHLYRAEYDRSRVATLKEAKEIVEHCLGRKGIVEDVTSDIYRQAPPAPFSLGTLQSEAYRIFRYTPRYTLQIAESLYLDALISYPRTSSEKIPQTVDCQGVLSSLAHTYAYGNLAKEMLTHTPLSPAQGSGYDPAHPAIYPTGIQSGTGLDRRRSRLFDLIVRRFLSAFASPAVKENSRIIFNLNGERFVISGRRTLNAGWLRFIEPYVRDDETPIPLVTRGETVVFNDVTYRRIHTTPPPRYNFGSLLRQMEAKELGTKSTRADIIETLFDRGYIVGKQMKATPLGTSVYETLWRYCPRLVSVELTRDLEQRMDAIRRGKTSKEEVVTEVSAQLLRIVDEFKRNEAAIAGELASTLRRINEEERTLGQCPVCHRGKLLILHSGRTGKRFAGCSNYKEERCTATFSLPQPPHRIWPVSTRCRSCGWPNVCVLSPRRKRPWTLCLNPRCPRKVKRDSC